MSEYLITVNNLKKYFPIKKGLLNRTAGHVKAVDGISFNIKRGQILGIVGESGCGKSTLGRTILRLLPPTGGEVFYEGKNVFSMNKREMNKMRTKMQIIFQDPYSSLNPRLPVYEIVGEAMLQHGIVKNKKEMKEKAIEVIIKCGLLPEQADRYPHQFSGGQRQRICIARAIAVNPDFIVCDEAVSALDVSIQSQIINLLKDAQEDFGLTYMFISHDLSVVRFISDEVAVMYLGQIIEKGGKKQIFSNPLHPYTEALLSAVPSIDTSLKQNKKRIILDGDIPSLVNPPKGCRFSTRCPYVKDICREETPEYREINTGHFTMCHKVNGVF
ncbi:MAG TPA: dipeptide ABC transporter ATP-binding protein [Sedimentibacter sp.]|nr:dipeptide ABC transporter ATP-binding protein [Sedimentibacter sp.]HOW23711.1 dipeptide ABC transporter ATP-binding protein [Sedimentibacter sp.]HRC80594.1 dipeptide ABC transporter ATP-binding protein [Sedimentibacter sp.]